MSIVKTRQANWWHHLGTGLFPQHTRHSAWRRWVPYWRRWVPYWRGWVQYICLIGCRLPPLDGYMAVCLVLAVVEVYGFGRSWKSTELNKMNKIETFGNGLKLRNQGRPIEARSQFHGPRFFYFLFFGFFARIFKTKKMNYQNFNFSESRFALLTVWPDLAKFRHCGHF